MTASRARHPTRRISTSPFPTRNCIKPPSRPAMPTSSRASAQITFSPTISMASWLRLLPTCRSTSGLRAARDHDVRRVQWCGRLHMVSGDRLLLPLGVYTFGPAQPLGDVSYSFLQNGGGSFSQTLTAVSTLAATPTGDGMLAIDGFRQHAGIGLPAPRRQPLKSTVALRSGWYFISCVLPYVGCRRPV